MKRTISFGKVDGYYNGRNSCEVTLEFGFQEFPNQEPYFSVCGNMWNNKHTDIIRGGQCVDDLFFEYFRGNKLFATILSLWEQYHLKPISAIPENDKELINKIIETGAL